MDKLVQTEFFKTVKNINHDEWTVLAGIIQIDTTTDSTKVVALGTGLKCLPYRDYGAHSLSHDLVRDLHAEVVCRRAFICYLIGQISILISGGFSIFVRDENAYSLRPGVSFSMYISHSPCGEASMTSTAHRKVENFFKSTNDAIQTDSIISISEFSELDTNESLKIHADQNKSRHLNSILKNENSINTSKFVDHVQLLINDLNSLQDRNYLNGHVIRGREWSHVLNKLRTKPGRRDSPDAVNLSCSDKIALWSNIGWTGSFLNLSEPIYISDIYIGDAWCDEGIHRLSLKCNHLFYKKNKASQFLVKFHPLVEHQFSLGQNDEHRRPSPVSHVWYWGIQKYETLVHGKLLGAKRPQGDTLNRKCQSSVSSYNLWVASLNIGKDVQSAVFDYRLKYENLKKYLLDDSESPFYGWYRSDSKYHVLKRNGEIEKKILNSNEVFCNIGSVAKKKRLE